MDERTLWALKLRGVLHAAIAAAAQQLGADSSIPVRMPDDRELPSRLRTRVEQTTSEYDAVIVPLDERAASLQDRLQALQQSGPISDRQAMETATELQALVMAFYDAKPDRLVDLFPETPVDVFNTADRPLTARHGRLYLDVTDANLSDIATIWTVVEWHQGKLRQRGLTTKRGRGVPRGPRPGGEIAKWVGIAQNIGEDAARERFKSETPPGRGAWAHRAKWWRDSVRPHL